MKTITSILLISLLSTTILSNEIEKTDEKQPVIKNKKVMTDDEFLKNFMQLENESKDLKKLNQTVDEIAQTLSVDK